MATTNNEILLPYLEDTGTDGNKLYTPKEWTERLRHYIKGIHNIDKQVGTGPSRRHIQGSKIAKRLPSVKYSSTVLENRNFLKKIFRKNYILKKMDRVARRGSLARAPGALKSHNAEKLKGWTL